MSFVRTDDEAIAPTDQSKAIAHLCIDCIHIKDSNKWHLITKIPMIGANHL
jgi:hypothetical protein